jgi:hypothetical protein
MKVPLPACFACTKSEAQLTGRFFSAFFSNNLPKGAIYRARYASVLIKRRPIKLEMTTEQRAIEC